MSVHAKTLDPRPLTDDGYDGPIAWWVRMDALGEAREWEEVARERAPSVLLPRTPRQAAILARLARLRD